MEQFASFSVLYGFYNNKFIKMILNLDFKSIYSMVYSITVMFLSGTIQELHKNLEKD